MAAVASYLEARRYGGHWLVRVEDIDPPREQPGATNEILRALERFEFEWDGPVTFQSESREVHEAAIRTLQDGGRVYPCDCSRRQLVDAPRGSLGIIYPGTCRTGCAGSEYAMRVLTTNTPTRFSDRLQGPQSQVLETESGDFVILRRDGLIAYQLAVVVDDELQEITDVVRGIDLMDSTPRQIWLQQLLGFQTPTYCHIPVAINAQGQKLSKSHGAPGIRLDSPAEALVASLQALGQQPPDDLAASGVAATWDWAFENWNIDVLKGLAEIDAAHNLWA